MAETRIYLVRHGETVWNTENKLQGAKDSPLTENGISHGFLMGKKLRSLGIEFSGMYTSDLGRAAATAGYIAGELGIKEAVKDIRLRERNLGIFEGYEWGEIKKVYPQEFAETVSDNDHYVIPEGESRAQHYEKVSSFMDYVKDNYEGRNLLAVTHRGFISFALRKTLGIPLNIKSHFVITNTILIVFVLVKGKWMLERFSSVE